MKKFLILFFCLPFLGISQVNAITEDGYQIQIFDDGTWKYLDTTLNEKRFIKENDTLFKVPAKSKMTLSSKIVDVQFQLNSEDWFYMSSPENEDSEFFLNNKSAEIYSIVISEDVQIPIKNLRNIALINARDTVENLIIIEEEYRNVNNAKVLYLSFEGEIEKLPVRYYNYYYSGEDGVVQFITYARKDVAITEQNSMFDLLNGFAKITD